MDVEVFHQHVLRVNKKRKNKLLCCNVNVCQKSFKKEAVKEKNVALAVVREKMLTVESYCSFNGARLHQLKHQFKLYFQVEM